MGRAEDAIAAPRAGRGWRDWRNAVALGASVLLVVGVLGAAELLLRAAERREPQAVEVSAPPTRRSVAMGWEPVPERIGRWTKRRGRQVIYDVTYTIDAFGRRVVPQAPGPAPTRFLLFFGGSNTFGEGLEDDETLPARTVQHLPGVRAYNYGYRGYGPQHLLARVESTDLRAQVEEPEGLAVYVMPGFHLSRLLGSSRTMRWAAELPYYREEGDHLVRDGFHQTTRPLRTALMQAIGRSRLVQWLGIAWPPRFTRSHERLACRVFAQARDELVRQFARIDLVVVLHPKEPAERWSCFDDVGIRTLDLRDAYGSVSEAELRIPGDGHTNARGNARLGRVLARELEPLLVAPVRPSARSQ